MRARHVAATSGRSATVCGQCSRASHEAAAAGSDALAVTSLAERLGTIRGLAGAPLTAWEARAVARDLIVWDPCDRVLFVCRSLDFS